MNHSSEKLLATLKRVNPSKLVAYLGNDRERNIAVPGGRKKWSQAVSVIESLDGWVKVELLDKGGSLLATVDNTDPAGELQDLTSPGGVPAQVERMLVIVLKAQQEAMKFRDAEVQGLLRAQADVLREQSAAVKSLTALYQAQVEAVRETSAIEADAAAAQAAAAAGSSEMQQLIEAAPAILQILPLVKGLLSGTVAVPNGVKGAH